MITYVDTSTLIKLLIDEAGTTEAGLIWDEPDVLVSVRIAHVEARAALAAARRQGRIIDEVFNNAVDGLEVLWSQLSVVEIDEELMRLAGDLATTHGLRGYDAIHLAAAHLVGAHVFSSADRRLCAAASSDGFHIANPIDSVVSVTGSEYSELDPYLSEEQPHIGYITQSIYVKPTAPPTTVAVIIGNFDGRPGNKSDLRLYLTHTPDEELPRRSLQLNWSSTPE